MAARENQGLLIAVIILVLLTLVLALAAFFGFSKAGENADSRKQWEEKQKFTDAYAESYQIQSDVLKALVGDLGVPVTEAQAHLESMGRLSSGFDGENQKTLQGIYEETKQIKEAFDKDMAGTTPDGGVNVSWRQRLRDLTSLVAKKVDEYNIQRQSTERTNLEAQTKIAANEKAMQTQLEIMNRLNEELASEKKRGLEKEQELKSKLDAAVAGNEAINKKAAADRQTADENYQAIKNEKELVEKTNVSLKLQIDELLKKDFDNADGQIINVSASLRTVYIDLGNRDGLVNNQTFSVYNQDITNFEEGKHKAMIEVTKVYPYRAEARIIQENPSNPILTGDHVLTATWDPGYSVPFALAGRFDLDGDIYDDTEKLIQMIKRNGGNVVAYHDEDGNVQGRIDSSVRYLVMGDAPISGENAQKPEAARAIVVAMQQMKEDAVANTVKEINLQKLLNRMGVRAKPKTIKYDDRIGGFRERQPSDTLKSEDN